MTASLMKSLVIVLLVILSDPQWPASDQAPIPIPEAWDEELRRMDGLDDVYALLVDDGQPIAIQIEDRSHKAARLIKVAVNRPGCPVMLILSCPKPAVWHFGWSEGSRISGVVTVGPFAQMVAGLPDGVPVINLPLPENRHGPLTGPVLVKTAQAVFGREPVGIIESVNGYLTVGEQVGRDQPLFTGAAFDLEQFRMPGTPPAGTEGLRAAIRKGWLKPVTIGDVRPCLKDHQRSATAIMFGSEYDVYAPDYGWVYPESYLVVSPDFVFPAAPFRSMTTFYIADGLPRPKGDPGGAGVVYLSNCAEEGSSWRRTE